MIQKFRKKPVIIDAIQWTGDNHDEISDFMIGIPFVIGMYEITIPTLEGDMIAFQSDWIIKGVAGEFYPCKPDIFEQTYEKV